jgi:hypothetical protein
MPESSWRIGVQVDRRPLTLQIPQIPQTSPDFFGLRRFRRLCQAVENVTPHCMELVHQGVKIRVSSRHLEPGTSLMSDKQAAQFGPFGNYETWNMVSRLKVALIYQNVA